MKVLVTPASPTTWCRGYERAPLIGITTADFREWLPSMSQTESLRRPDLRVDIVKEYIPKEDAADLPILAKQDALAKRMALAATGDDE